MASMPTNPPATKATITSVARSMSSGPRSTQWRTIACSEVSTPRATSRASSSSPKSCAMSFSCSS